MTASDPFKELNRIRAALQLDELERERLRSVTPRQLAAEFHEYWVTLCLRPNGVATLSSFPYYDLLFEEILSRLDPQWESVPLPAPVDCAQQHEVQRRRTLIRRILGLDQKRK